MKTCQFCCIMMIILLMSACSLHQEASPKTVDPPSSAEDPARDIASNHPNQKSDFSGTDLAEIYFAGGCFWGVEAYFERIPGVYETSSGYANGTGTNPTYASVISGEEAFAETVMVVYDPERVTLNELLAYFFAVIDPTIKDQQGNDIGVQYRTGVYYVNEEQNAMIKAAFKQEQENYEAEIVTERLPLENFYLAEEEHQDYLTKNPNGYCHIDLDILNKIEIDPKVYSNSH